jgi:hypothetical protein
MPHVIGREGRIAALIFGYPLRSPPSPKRRNKILWVARKGVPAGAALRVRARRMIGTRVVGRTVSRAVPGGPGPSIINLPDAGCWRLTLTWSGGRDTLDLLYRAR